MGAVWVERIAGRRVRIEEPTLLPGRIESAAAGPRVSPTMTSPIALSLPARSRSLREPSPFVNRRIGGISSTGGAWRPLVATIATVAILAGITPLSAAARQDPVKAWCARVKTGYSFAHVAVWNEAPAGARIGSFYRYDGKLARNWTWPDGVTVVWSNLAIVAKSC